MTNIIKIPWTASNKLPPWVELYFWDKWEVLNCHLDEENTTMTLEQWVEKLINEINWLPEWKKITLRWHSLWTRIIMHAVIKNPEILKKIKKIQLITPPFSHTEFEEKLSKSVKKRNPSINFTDNYLASLKEDNYEINAIFGETIKNSQFKGRVELFIDKNDKILKRLHGENYNEKSIKKFIQNLISENTWIFKIKFVNFWHNFENYDPIIVAFRKRFSWLVKDFLEGNYWPAKNLENLSNISWWWKNAEESLLISWINTSN